MKTTTGDMLNTMGKLLLVFVFVAISLCIVDPVVFGHQSLNMSGGCKVIQAGILGTVQCKGLLFSMGLILLALVALQSSPRFTNLRDSLLAIRGAPPGLWKRLSTHIFFDTAYRQLRQLRVYATATIDPQVFVAQCRLRRPVGTCASYLFS